ncbi:Fe-S cluster assembly protein SufD [Vibrio sp. Of7-15]|uniref:Fe-S cluster assembly protein SufD n=1 Tax=Vibrio sp. Of7-15 TaxID=2724879 RepID=UPI001EF3C8F4|nr:Fe-S cluster assembly protein SufD [Vibrio sp. Of7-15]MCG7499764.1 Fe-S cluster assembly protein SufD [Vibrio sp. Of7-15]
MAGLLEKSDTQWSLFDRNAPLDGYGKQHWQSALELGLPTSCDEDWKYTDLSEFQQLDFFEKKEEALTTQQVEQCRMDCDAYILVFVNGVYQPALSDSDIGMFRLSSLESKAKEKLPHAIRPEIFLHLTEAMSHSGLCISLGESCQAEKPLYLLHIETPASGAIIQARNHIVLGQHSQACVIEHFVSLADRSTDENASNLSSDHVGNYVGARLTMQVESNSQLEHYHLCQGASRSFYFSHNDLHIGRDAKVSSQSFLLSGQLIRHHSSSVLNGENSELMLNSLCLPDSNCTYDSRTYLEHNKGHCTSEQLHKMIVQDQATAVFDGMIKVAPHALKTNGQMDNHNLLLSDECAVNTKPQLEIYADDVKCSHGTTTGAISEEHVFYLQARGIPQCQAEQMITFAFAAELTEAITIPAIAELVCNCITKKLSENGNEG